MTRLIGKSTQVTFLRIRKVAEGDYQRVKGLLQAGYALPCWTLGKTALALNSRELGLLGQTPIYPLLNQCINNLKTYQLDITILSLRLQQRPSYTSTPYSLALVSYNFIFKSISVYCHECWLTH